MAWATLKAMVSELGEDRVLALAINGYTNKAYRKRRNAERDALVEEAKKNKETVERIKAKLAAEFGN